MKRFRIAPFDGISDPFWVNQPTGIVKRETHRRSAPAQSKIVKEPPPGIPNS